MVEYLSNGDIGRIGESLATRYLAQLGYRILERNYSLPGVGEIDIIAFHKGVFHFIEVKSSLAYSINSEYHPSRNFDFRKKERIAHVMRRFCDIYSIESPRTVGLIVLSFSRETLMASVFYEPYILMDTV